MDQKQLTIGTRLWSRLRWRVEMLYLAGHSALRPTPVPMHMVRYTHPEAQRPCCLIVFLPGRWNRALQYETEQFVQVVYDTEIQADMVAVEAHYGSPGDTRWSHLGAAAAARVRPDHPYGDASHSVRGGQLPRCPQGPRVI